ncbi:MAG: hypothetical protein ABUT20_64540 [Bacteroidota bacterium]
MLFGILENAFWFGRSDGDRQTSSFQLVVYATFDIKVNKYPSICIFVQRSAMGNTITINLRNKKARKVLQSLEELKLIDIIYDSTIAWTPKKKKQAKDFLSAYNQAKTAVSGKIKLKSAQSLLNEL